MYRTVCRHYFRVCSDFIPDKQSCRDTFLRAHSQAVTSVNFRWEDMLEVTHCLDFSIPREMKINAAGLLVNLVASPP